MGRAVCVYAAPGSDGRAGSAGQFNLSKRLKKSYGRKQTMAVENAPARIGKTVVIRGEVKGSEDLIVDGRVEGTVSLSESRLTIGSSANVAADLSAKEILVLGQVQGNIEASGRVELRAGCQVVGDIRALRLSVEDNAVFRGKVDLTQGSPIGPSGASAPQAGGDN
jgi:cytoskeletal protein CcmA (bactofilin family)